MSTALSLITKAMQKVGVLVKSESPSADESADGLDALNDMLSSWSNDSLLVYARVTESFTLAAGTSSYTIGSGATFNTTRPINIVQAHVRQTGSNIDYPISPVSDEIYQGVALKTLQSIPFMLNYTNGFPTGTINLYPTPNEAFTLYLTSEKELTQFDLSTTVSLPPGWKRALIYNLAIELAPEYGQQLDPVTLKIANDSKMAIAQSIAKARSMDAQPYVNIGQFYVLRGY
jgi:hypothetical protein